MASTNRLVECSHEAECSPDTHASQLQERIRELQAKARELEDENRRLRKAAHIDCLTGIPNRALWTDRLEMAVARARRDAQQLAVLFVDLDGFKPINDKFGHEAGDLVLRGTATRIVSVLREVDTVARIGGDEFAVLLERIEDEDVGVVEKKIRDAIGVPYRFGSRMLRCSASIGTAQFPLEGQTGAALLRRADLKMLAAKAASEGTGRRRRPGR